MISLQQHINVNQTNGRASSNIGLRAEQVRGSDRVGSGIGPEPEYIEYITYILTCPHK